MRSFEKMHKNGHFICCKKPQKNHLGKLYLPKAKKGVFQRKIGLSSFATRGSKRMAEKGRRTVWDEEKRDIRKIVFLDNFFLVCYYNRIKLWDFGRTAPWIGTQRAVLTQNHPFVTLLKFRSGDDFMPECVRTKRQTLFLGFVALIVCGEIPLCFLSYVMQGSPIGKN